MRVISESDLEVGMVIRSNYHSARTVLQIEADHYVAVDKHGNEKAHDLTHLSEETWIDERPET